MQSISKYKKQIATYIDSINLDNEPRELYDPISYILTLGGKQIRPILTLMASDAFGTSPKKAINAAMAVELFHNFSLIHDDIMDNAPLRRGLQTVHEKWNINTGILSGDAMLILAYQYFENYEAEIFKKLAKLFSKTALEVCEGQQLDINFESRSDVSISEYIKMIEFKTAVLVGAALKMGAIVANASEENAQKIYDFGLNLGIAFQLQDDYLDAFGDEATFGKTIGGDILENKKTFLYLDSLSKAIPEQQRELREFFSTVEGDKEFKINRVKTIFVETKSELASQELIRQYTERAFGILEGTDILEDKKDMFRGFGLELMNRNV